MKIVTHDHGVGGADEIDVSRRNIVLKIEHPLRQDQPNEIGKNPGKGVGLRNTHQSNIGISKQWLDDWGFRRQRKENSVESTVEQRLDRGRSGERQQRCALEN